MKNLTLFIRFLVGGLFVFSGLVKANDPMGFGFKLQEYFEVFHMDWLNPLAFSLSIIFCGLEIILGLFLIMGLYRKVVLYSLMLLILFFSILTFVSAYYEVVTSCGCFGDAIPLTPWESFSKDVVLSVLIVYLYFYRHFIQSYFSHQKSKIFAVSLSVLFGFGFGIYTYNNLPFVDFLPYKKGNNIPKLMHIPADAPADEFEIIFELENINTGELVKIDSKAYVEQGIYKDSTLKYKSRQTKLIKKGFSPKIADFRLLDSEGIDKTAEVLNYEWVLLITFDNISESNLSSFEEINNLINGLNKNKINIIGLSSSSNEAIENLVNTKNLNFPIYISDSVPLKSMVRSNPGLLLLNKGTIIDKWHNSNVPTQLRLKQLTK